MTSEHRTTSLGPADSGPPRALGMSLAELAGTSLLAEVWQHFPEHIFLIRVEGEDDFVIEATNPTHQATLGAHIDGSRLHDFLPEATARKVAGRYRDCLAKASPMRYEEHAAYVDATGATRFGYWITLLVPVHLHDDDRITHLFGISQNVTELRQANQALEHYNQELEARVAERTAELRAANEALQTLNRRLERLATRDHLTGVLNRRQLETLAETALQDAARRGDPLCLLMLDLDNFKQINDSAGHTAGDAALVQAADVLRSGLRDGDLLGRYGGDEFVILLPNTPARAGQLIAERLRELLSTSTPLTVSIGITEYREREDDLDALTRRADGLLLNGKQGGRDRVVVG